MSEFPKKRMIGFCSSCGEVVIDLTKDGRKASAKFKENYKEHIIELSNKTIMRVGVCDKCKIELVSGKNPLKIAKKIIKNHIDYWTGHRKEAPRSFEEIKVVHPNTNLRQFLRKKEKVNQDRELTKMLNVK